MRILALSDLHGHLPALDVSRVDCVMIAGDICPEEAKIPSFQRPWLERAFGPWAELLAKPVYLALGNHDFCNYFSCPPNLIYGTEEIIGQVLLFSWTLPFADYAWEIDEGGIEDKLEALLGPVRAVPPIWLTHGPPFGVCDGLEDHHHNGSRALRAAVEKYEPRALICGHIHEAKGRGLLGRTMVYNVSIADSRRDQSGGPVFIEV